LYFKGEEKPESHVEKAGKHCHLSSRLAILMINGKNLEICFLITPKCIEQERKC
jgi:hypothetical protein